MKKKTEKIGTEKIRKWLSIDAWFMRAARLCNKYGKYYISVKRLPKLCGSECFDYSKKGCSGKDVAIVMQGPLQVKNGFTFATAKLYRSIFQDASVIISTWVNEDKDTIEGLKNIGCTVVQSELPEQMGCLNINAQILSSQKGIEEAKRQKKEYTLKTRTDWRIYYPHTFGYLRGMIQDKEGNCDGRIVVIDNFNNRTVELPPFFISDYFYFGKTDRVEKVFDIPFNNFPYQNMQDYVEKNKIGRPLTFEEQCALNLPPEYYICTEYLKNLGEEGDFSSREYYVKCIKKYFVFISPWDIDAYWPKYGSILFQPTSWMRNEENTSRLTGTVNMGYPDYINYINGRYEKER